MSIIDKRLCVIVAGVSLVAGSRFVQATSPAPNPTAPVQAAPDAKSTAPAELSKKLNEANGVIHPKEVDPGIQKPAPKTGDTNVVPPPGTSGAAAPQPK